MKKLLLIIPLLIFTSYSEKIDSTSNNKTENIKQVHSEKKSDSTNLILNQKKINDSIKNNSIQYNSNSKKEDKEKNIKLIFDLITAIGSLATVGSFIYLFRRDKDKQAQIDELTKIVSSLTSLQNIENQKLNLSVRPDIKQNGGGYQGYDGEWHLNIENIGEKTTLTKLELISDGLVLHNEHIPYVMEKNSTRKIFARTNSEKHVKDCEFILNIHHTDKIGNLHIVTFKGIGATITERTTKNCV